jgi:anti-sigma factor RsiW
VTDDIACAELVELATEYLEDALPAAERERIERHLRECDGCEAHLRQLRAALRIAGALPPEELSAGALEAILRAWAA